MQQDSRRSGDTLHGVRSRENHSNMAAALSGLKLPGPLNLEGNLAGNWKKWLTAYKIYARATGVTAKPEKKPQCFVLLHVAGEKAQKLFPTLDIEPSDRKKIGPLTDAFRQYCESNANVTVVRYQLNMFYQRDESMDTYKRSTS